MMAMIMMAMAMTIMSVSLSFCPCVCQSVRDIHLRAMNNIRVSVSLLFKSVCLSVS